MSVASVVMHHSLTSSRSGSVPPGSGIDCTVEPHAELGRLSVRDGEARVLAKSDFGKGLAWARTDFAYVSQRAGYDEGCAVFVRFVNEPTS
jgi:hypothetical protein